MLNYIWPIALVVLSNVIYQICAKSVPNHVNPFASLTITYIVGAISSAVLYFLLGGGNLVKEIGKMNWASYALGLAIIGLELGFLYVYKAGWQISTASIVQSSFLAVILIFVGMFLYNEPLTWNKIVGIIVCLIGLVFINIK